MPHSDFFSLSGGSVSRYVFAEPYVTGRKVFDAGCGHGYGSHYLASGIADSVYGLDIDVKAIDFARKNYKRPNLVFEVGSLTERLPGDYGSYFGACVSFEVIEHIQNPRSYLDVIAYALKERGTLILSTPNRICTDLLRQAGYPSNPHHVKEFTPEELRELLDESFENLRCFGQFTDEQLRFDALKQEVAIMRYARSSIIPKSFRRLAPASAKNWWMRRKGITLPSDSRGMWRSYRFSPISEVMEHIERIQVQVWVATKRQL